MPQNVIQYDLLISCPGDVRTEVELIKQAVDDFNSRYSDVLGISIRTKHWSKNSYAQSGGKPQKLLNEQLVKDCDAAIAIFWTRFGTPTDEYGSGTEEEIELMLESGKQVFMYFSDKPMSPSEIDSAEYARVKAFREKYKDRGIYSTFLSDDEFSKLIIAHLSQYFLSIKKISELEIKRAPKLSLKGIDRAGVLSAQIYTYPFVPFSKYSVEQHFNQIRQMYQDVADIPLGQNAFTKAEGKTLIGSATGYFSTAYPPVTIEESKKELLDKTAGILGLSLPDNFFDLGNLSEDTLQSSISFSGLVLKGTPNEKKKYRLIDDLCTAIVKTFKWKQIADKFSKISCMKFAVENEGTAIDEDVEVTLFLEKGSLLYIENYPHLSNDEKSYLLNDCDMEDLFCICSAAQYMEYTASTRNRALPSPHIPSSPLLGPKDYSDDYENELHDIFCYDIYNDGGQYDILKLRFDYIKHHTTIAFPTPIFMKSIPEKISYQITSQNMAEVESGTIEILVEEER